MGKRERKSKKPKKTEKKQEQIQQENPVEDYCFVCKDGGLLMLCDHKECGKAYHPNCVGKEESNEEEEEEEEAAQWICAWHNCLMCKRSSRYQCFCCPNAVCQHCFKDTEFARIRGSKGFCNNCLKLALLGEEGLDFDSDGEKVDFKDRETYEGLFKEYWDIIKEKEGLLLEDLYNADVQINKGEYASSRSHKKSENVKPQSNKPDSDSDEYKKEEENKESSDDHDSDDGIQPVEVRPKKKSKTLKEKPKPKPRPKPKPKGGSKRMEFLGWASKALIEFLVSVGIDTNKKLSQSEVVSLISKYVQDNKLFHPEKKKVVLCDLRMQTAFARKSFSIYKLNDVLEPHLAENIEQSDDEGYSSGYEENNASLSTKKDAWWRKAGSFQHKGPLLEKFQQKEAILEEPIKKDPVVTIEYSRFATIIPQNMKLVYLRKSLVEQLLGQYETFESKVVGSFVKVKCDPVDVKRPYQLLPVTGITTSADDADKMKVLFQISNMPNEVPIRRLSNDDLSEEDCEDLQQKVESGLLEKPTVVELEKKAKTLHEDITKHSITRELSILRYRIDLANEKGRRAELYEYRRRRDQLQSEEEQCRLLKEVPQVIAEIIEIKPDSEEPQDEDTPEKVVSALKNPDEKSEESKITP